jgi:hypothetical protein
MPRRLLALAFAAAAAAAAVAAALRREQHGDVSRNGGSRRDAAQLRRELERQ